ncbi:MAG: hypothetical protein K0R12_969 [Gammaproteobacteria bacterium]|jgi:predicted phosphate transport protein (TIGR00153 family)|nr:hypothetical protein [Gammaproteobacteria bacterium]
MKPASIFNVFGRSPIRPLQEHMEKICACTDSLILFFNAVFANDWTQAQTYQLQIATMENEADKIKRELRLHLPNSLFLPVSRSDLLETLTVQDKIADKARHIAGLIIGRKLCIPSAMQPVFLEFLQCNLQAVQQTKVVVNELSDLMETGFSATEIAVIEKMIHTIDKIESDSDQMQIKVRKTLYDLEKNLSPIDVFFLYKIVELVGQLADGAKHVGDNLQLLLAR